MIHFCLRYNKHIFFYCGDDNCDDDDNLLLANTKAFHHIFVLLNFYRIFIMILDILSSVVMCFCL